MRAFKIINNFTKKNKTFRDNYLQNNFLNNTMAIKFINQRKNLSCILKKIVNIHNY